jgi:hypothetical protein
MNVCRTNPLTREFAALAHFRLDAMTGQTAELTGFAAQFTVAAIYGTSSFP